MKEKVYRFLMAIPKGKVATYGQIAEYLGNKKLARVVGNILHNNPDENKYPCYKVVDSNGNLSKKFVFGGIEKQKERLEKDGIVVKNYKVDLAKYKLKESKMAIKDSNEITVKIKGDLKEFYKDIEEKGFELVERFSINDTYFIPEKIELLNGKIREILSKAVIVREFKSNPSGKTSRKITFKTKEFDEKGNILSQNAVNCSILEVEEAKKLLKAIGYKEIMNIKEDDKVYQRYDFKFAVKEIEDGDNLIEAESEENPELKTIENLIQKINELKIPIYLDDYFVKKAEIELLKKRNN